MGFGVGTGFSTGSGGGGGSSEPVYLEDITAPAGTIAQNFSRSTGVNQNGPTLTSGTLRICGHILIPGGESINAINFLCGGQAFTPGTNQWACLVDENREVVAVSTDRTTEAWPLKTPKAFTLAAPYTPTEDIIVQPGICTVGGTPPTLVAAQLAYVEQYAIAPIVCGNSTTGLTTPVTVGTTLIAYTANLGNAWCWLT